MDVNHRAIASLRAYRPMAFCLPPYHALHHASPDAHFSSWITEIGRGRKLPVEVWATGSESEWLVGGGDDRAFARHARRYYFDDRVIYRHIVRAPIRSAPIQSAPPDADC